MSYRRWLTLILAACLLVRAGFLLLYPQTLSLRTSGYDAYAVNVLDGHGYTRFADRQVDSDLPPLYPFFLVGVYAVLGRGAIQVAVVQTAVDGGTLLLVFLIGRRIAGPTVGLLAAAFFGLYPYLIYQNLSVNDTGLFIFLLAAGVWLSYRVYDTRDWRLAAALGAILGLASLTKAFALLLWPLLIIWWLRHLGLAAIWRPALAGGVTTILVIAPWVVRNSLLDGQPVFISTNGGSNLYQGNNACVADYLDRGWDAQWVDCLATPPPGLNDAALDQWNRRQAIDYLVHHRDQWLHLLWSKFRVLWSPVITPTSVPPGATVAEDPVLLYSSPIFQSARVIHVIYFGPLLALGLAGIVIALRRHDPIVPLLAVLMAVTLTYLIFHPSTRYRSPADPFLFVFSAIAVERLWAWARSFRPAAGV